MKHLTFDGKSTIPQAKKVIQLTLTNTTDKVEKKILVPSPARLRHINYNNSILKQGENCVVEGELTLEYLQNFAKACPIELCSVTVSPIQSSNFIEQLSNAVAIKTPTLGDDIVENLQADSASQVGTANFLLHNIFLGDVAEVEITILPQSSIKVTLELGPYMSRRLVPSK